MGAPWLPGAGGSYRAFRARRERWGERGASGVSRPAPEARAGFLFGCAERQAARANNSSYNNNPPSRSWARLGLLRPSYCLDTCQELGSQQSHRVPAPCRRFLSSPLPSPKKGAQKATWRGGRAWKETSCSGLRPPSQVQRPESGGVATSAVRLPPWLWGLDSNPGESSCTLRRRTHLWAVAGRPRGCPGPGAWSYFFHLCHQVSAAELRRIRETRGADTRTHIGLPFSCLLGSPRISRYHRPSCHRSTVRNAPGGPGRRTPPAWPLHSFWPAGQPFPSQP